MCAFHFEWRENGQAVQSSRTRERGESFDSTNTHQLTCNDKSMTSQFFVARRKRTGFLSLLFLLLLFYDIIFSLPSSLFFLLLWQRGVALFYLTGLIDSSRHDDIPSALCISY